MTKSESIASEADFFLLNSSKGANSRKNILKTLLSGFKSCNQVAIELKLNWRTAYRHLQILEKETFVKSFSFGQRKVYKLTRRGEVTIKRFSRSNATAPTIRNETLGENCLNSTEYTSEIPFDGE
jgi:predicted transcriptional regulator